MIIPVNLGEKSYDVVIEKGVFARAEKELKLDRRVLIVSDDGVPPQYAKSLAEKCKFPVISVIKSGENHKNLETMQELFQLMIDNNFTRKDCVVAVGGGMVGDLCGFTAACYMRGIDFYNIPTTVLSAVDSSVGGKTAVNFGNVKNIIGSFWQPKKVLIDVDLLKTLPARQVSNGLAEALKMALTFDNSLVEVFQNGNPFDPVEMEKIIQRSVQLKANVVEQDEKEAGLRKVLNFGHTIGHGIEITSGGQLYHGECVGLGMICLCSENVRNLLIPILKKLNLPVSYKVDVEKACQAIKHDKKASENAISTIHVNQPGTFEVQDMTLDQLKERLALVVEK